MKEAKCAERKRSKSPLTASVFQTLLFRSLFVFSGSFHRLRGRLDVCRRGKSPPVALRVIVPSFS